MREQLLQQILEEIKALNQRVSNIENGQKELTTLVSGIEKDLTEIKGTTTRIETKQQIIYEHTAKLSEYHTDIKHQIEDVKDHIQFNTHKITENEREIFKLKNQ